MRGKIGGGGTATNGRVFYVEEARFTSKIGGWTGLQDLVGIGIDFTAGFYEPEFQPGRVTGLEKEDINGTNVSKEIVNFDVGIDILGFANVIAAFAIADDFFVDERDADDNIVQRRATAERVGQLDRHVLRCACPDRSRRRYVDHRSLLR